MLRRFHVGRIAHNDLPEQERRLLRVSAPGNRRRELTEAEQHVQRENDDIVARHIEAMRLQESEKLRGAVPELLLTEQAFQRTVSFELFDAVLQCKDFDHGALEQIILQANPRAKRGLQDFPTLEAEEKQRVIRDALAIATPAQLLEITTFVAADLHQHEADMGAIAAGIKYIFSALEEQKGSAAGTAFSDLTESDLADLRVILEGQDTDLLRKQSLFKLLSVARDVPELRSMREAVTSVREKQYRKQLFGLTPGETIALTPDEESRARRTYVGDLHEAESLLKNLLDARLQEIAKRRLETLCGKKERHAIAERLRELGLSPEAVARSIGEAAAPLAQVLRVDPYEIRDDDPVYARSVTEYLRKNAAPLTDDTAQYLTYASDVLEQLQDTAWIEEAEEDSEEKFLDDLFEHERMGQLHAIEWAKTQAERFKAAAERMEEGRYTGKVIAAYAEISSSDPEELKAGFARLSELMKRVGSGEITEDDRHLLCEYFSGRQREQYELMATHLTNPIAAREFLSHHRLREQQRTIARKHVEAGTVEDEAANLDEELIYLETQFFSSESKVRSLLQHETCRALGVEKRLHGRLDQIRARIKRLRKAADPEDLQAELTDALAEIRQLQHFMKELTRFAEAPETDAEPSVSRIRELPAEEFEQVAGSQRSRGFYNHTDGRIYLKAGLADEERAQVLDHEIGHALVDLMVHRTGVFPDIVITLTGQLESATDRYGDGRTFWQLLRGQAGEWGIAQQRGTILQRFAQKGLSQEEAGQETGEMLDHMLADELINRYASWVAASRPPLPETTELERDRKSLFALLDGRSENPAKLLNDIKSFDTGDVGDSAALGLGDVTAALQETTEAAEEGSDIKQEFNKVKDKIETIDAFAQAHPENEDEFRGPLRRMRERNKELYDAYIDEGAENRAGLRQLDADIKPILDVVERELARELDLTDAPVTGRNAVSIRWMSINDVIQMVKSGAEDVQRMWKRRGEQVQSAVGEALTDWIPNNVYYIGRLKHEYKRRELKSDVDEVHQWKEALEDADSYHLQHLLGVTRNRDQLRALLELLSDRGRLDWNDVHFWETLNELSQYRMPIEACRNNDILRDKWLQKLITDIWSDKEHYYNWRRNNDSNYESNVEKFTSQTDQISGITGALADELERQLSLFKKAKAEHADSLPEAVNPHMYEKIIRYSIANGKMSMEQKFYYLVQGVAVGLLSIDRIRVIAGEKGGILLKFPFIDYFYGKNNSFPEIRRLAKRLTEYENGVETERPGPKTSMWLQMEVAREENARIRVSKALGRDNPQAIDHEDVPQMVCMMNVSLMGNFLGNVSGDRWKATKEGWKNAYVGFNTKFKAYARLVEMQDEHLTKFTKGDIKDLTTAIGAFVMMDKTLRGRRSSTPSQARLSADDYEEAGPSSNGIATKVFRERAHQFINELIDRLPIRWENTGMTREQFKEDLLHKQGDTKETLQTIGEAMGTFQQELERALAVSTGTLPQLLKEHAGKFVEEQSSEKPDGTYEEHITKAAAKTYFQELRAETQTGNGHGDQAHDAAHVHEHQGTIAV